MRSFVVKPGASTRPFRPKRVETGPRTARRRHELAILFHEELKASGYPKSESWTIAQSIAEMDVTDAELHSALDEAKRRRSVPTTGCDQEEPTIVSKIELVIRDLQSAHGGTFRIVTSAYDPRTGTATINLAHDIGSRPTG